MMKFSMKLKNKTFLMIFWNTVYSLIFNSKGAENEKISCINCEQFSSLDVTNKFGDVILHDELSKQQIANFSNNSKWKFSIAVKNIYKIKLSDQSKK